VLLGLKKSVVSTQYSSSRCSSVQNRKKLSGKNFLQVKKLCTYLLQTCKDKNLCCPDMSDHVWTMCVFPNAISIPGIVFSK